MSVKWVSTRHGHRDIRRLCAASQNFQLRQMGRERPVHVVADAGQRIGHADVQRAGAGWDVSVIRSKL